MTHAADDLTGKAVLIVEDEYYLAADLAQLLQRAGAEVLGPFPDQEPAIAMVKARRPDCAVLDVNLGRGACFDLADLLSERSVPFLFFTGYDRVVLPERFSTTTRVEKPVSDAKLRKAIGDLAAAKASS